jgi:hypothetical protein
MHDAPSRERGTFVGQLPSRIGSDGPDGMKTCLAVSDIRAYERLAVSKVNPRVYLWLGTARSTNSL